MRNDKTISDENLKAIEYFKKAKEYVSNKNVNLSSVVLTNIRHIEAVKTAIECINSAIESAGDELANLDLVSIDIKSVWIALGDITGNSDNEKIIDDIFSKFCVGK